MSLSKAEYRRWLQAAYHYYWGFLDEPLMSDSEWDSLGKRVVLDEHDELRGTSYVPGQSLFWLPKDKYPEWAKELP